MNDPISHSPFQPKILKRASRAAVSLLLCSLVYGFGLSTHAQGTAFTYQGRLNNNGVPVDGTYDLRFKLFTDPFGNNQAGGAAVTNGVPVANGLFTVTIDFGGGIFTGTNYWLEVDVKTNGAAGYENLSPLQAVTPVPYALFAENATGAGLAAGIYTNAVSLNNPSNTFSGSFTGNGGGLTNVNATTLGGLSAVSFWNVLGNTGTSPTNGNFIGTADFQPLDLRVNGMRTAEWAPTTNTANIIGGDAHNFVGPGIYGATIGGGGTPGYPGGTNLPNVVLARFGTIGGGTGNTVGNNPSNTGDSATIAGGWGNVAFGNNTTVGGGGANTNWGDNSVIGGGYGNLVQTNAQEATISGGNLNTLGLNAYYTTIAGGYNNSILSPWASIGGGGFHLISTNSNSGTISGGYGHTIKHDSFDCTIGGGSYGIIGTNNYYCTIAGGRDITINDNSTSSAVGGGLFNSVQGSAPYSAIGGGYFNSAGGLASTVGGGYNGQAKSNYCTVSGGYNNAATYISATVSGGYQNTASNDSSVVGGGVFNVAGGAGAVVSGGIQNLAAARAATVSGGGGNYAASTYATIGGGTNNTASGNGATIGGGFINSATLDCATVGGGTNNMASAIGATVAGGFNNSATVNFATIGGGNGNAAGGANATVPGGSGNIANGANSFAAGTGAQAVHNNSFVWSDGSSAFSSSAPNQFAVQASGGVAMAADVQLSGGYHNLSLSGGNSAGFLYGSYPALGDGVHLGYNWYYDANGVGHCPNPGGGTSRISVGYGAIALCIGGVNTHPLSTMLYVDASGVCTPSGTINICSDRNAKEDFSSVSPSVILEKVAQLPVTEWSYKTDARTRHIGPMAQDFHSAFDIGMDERHISPMDESGVALAAIKGLNQKVEEKEARIREQDRKLRQLERTVEQLQDVVNKLYAQQNGGEL